MTATMNIKSKPKVQNLFYLLVVVLALILALTVPVGSQDKTQDKIKDHQDKINLIKEQISSIKIDLDGLIHHETTLKEALDQFDQDIEGLNQAVSQTEAGIEQVNDQIVETEAVIEKQIEVVGQILRLLYQASDASSIELLLAADSFSDYIDNQEYLGRLQVELVASVSRTQKSLDQLKRQKLSRQKHLGDLQFQQSLIKDQQAQKAHLLRVTQNRQDVYQTRMTRLRAEQAAAERAFDAFMAQLMNKPQVSLGPVKAGDMIGKLGNTGWSTGPHLHIVIRTRKDLGIIYDPLKYIPENNLAWPVGGYGGTVTQGYHARHRAADIGGPEGLPILAIADGEMLYRGCMNTDSKYRSFGVVLKHNQGQFYSVYIHLQAPDNSKYNICNKNTMPGSRLYGQTSIDYSTTW